MSAYLFSLLTPEGFTTVDDLAHVIQGLDFDHFDHLDENNIKDIPALVPDDDGAASGAAAS